MYGVAGYGRDTANGGILFVITDTGILKFYLETPAQKILGSRKTRFAIVGLPFIGSKVCLIIFLNSLVFYISTCK